MWVIMSHFSHSSSTLNPNAPMFVPMAYRSVEDFSDQWWALVQSCPWFRDYWLQERFHDPQSELAAPDQTPFPNANGFCCDPHAEAEAEADLPDDDDLDDYYSLFFNQQEDQEEEMMMMMMMMREYYNNNSMNSCRDLVSMKKRRKGARPLVRAPPWNVEKPPKIVNMKVSPRTINQPK